MKFPRPLSQNDTHREKYFSHNIKAKHKINKHRSKQRGIYAWEIIICSIREKLLLIFRSIHLILPSFKLWHVSYTTWYKTVKTSGFFFNRVSYAISSFNKHKLRFHTSNT